MNHGESRTEETFLPVNRREAEQWGWQQPDFVLVSGDAYVDHPAFGAALLARLLEREGYSVGLLAQPDFSSPEAMKEYGSPRLGFLVSGGVVDSMVAHYTSAKKRRHFDEYTPGGRVGKRPDRAVEVYSRLIKQAYPDVPVIIGGLEASLRRFAGYDYWSDAVRPSVLEASGADLLVFGMGERPLLEIARRLATGEQARDITGVPGTAYLTDFAALPQKYAECASFAKVKGDKTAYAKACRIQMEGQDAIGALPVVQKQSARYLVQNPPAPPLGRDELDRLYELPFTRRAHPMYEPMGGVPALEEVEFSIAHNRGCFGGCNFCAITLHQGRRVTSRSEASLLREAEDLTKLPGFKGYIHDVGGPTANFRGPSCDKQKNQPLCKGGKRCLFPSPCANLKADHSEYLSILRKMRALPGVKRVFIRSGIRYDYLLADKNPAFFRELVAHHVSGQLKVAPEHCAPAVLNAMGKPSIKTYDRFSEQFYKYTKQAGKEQYLVPYLLSSHPGSTLKDAVRLAEYLAQNRIRPEQVQDFYPTPGTVSTCMFYTGLDPYTLKPVHVPRTPEEKQMQRALLQYYRPENAAMVRRALAQTHRQDLAPLLLGRPMRREERPKAPAAKTRDGRGRAAKPGRKKAAPSKGGRR